MKKYNLRPASGQALLNYQNRLPPKEELTFYEAETAEEVRPKGKTENGGNYLLRSDCLATCAWMREQNISADLVYIDPPFASGANYAKKIHLRNGGELKKETAGLSIGEEVMYADIWQKEDYLNWIYERLLAIREVMSETGSIYVHLDWHIGHYVKILMDEIFGEDNFRNEIIWCYTFGAARGKQFARKHDTIFFYSRNNNNESWIFNADKAKRPARSNWAQTSGIKEVTELDWWDIPSINNDERVDYPTQKPRELLERIIEVSSNKGMVVADFFSGSGTTAEIAHKLGRRFVVCDIGQNSAQITRGRLIEVGAPFDILTVKDGMHLFRNLADTEKKLFSAIPNWTTREKAKLEEFWDGAISMGEKYAPVKFTGMDKKLTMDYITVVLEQTAQTDAENAVIIYVQKAANVSQAEVNKAAREYSRSDTSLKIKSLEELLGETVGQIFSEDSAEIDRKKESGKMRVKIRKFYSPYLQGKIKEYNTARQETLENRGGKKINISDSGLELIESVQFGSFAKNGAWKSIEEDSPSEKEKIKGDYLVGAAATHIKIRSIAGDEICEEL